ncbi:MAG: hypothetical protein LBB88_00355 [Planctomycetaceae bacterium]|jgi:hypothetical protein|nr:hypothetical protein [Planctomycetaceae bacterium]
MKLTLNKTRVFSEIFLLLISFLICFFLLQTNILSGEESKVNRADNVASLINESTCMLAYVNIDKIDVDEYFKKNFKGVENVVKMIGFDSNSEKRITKELLSVLQSVKTEFKLRFDKWKSSTDVREAYFLLQVGLLDKLKNAVKMSFVFAIPTDKRNKDELKEIRELIQNDDLSWSIGQYGGFDVLVAEMEIPLPQEAAVEQPTPIVVPPEDEISPADELIDGDELTAREKNWINNFFSKNNKDVAELIKDSFAKHESDAPVRIVFTNLKNLINAFDYAYLRKSINEMDNTMSNDSSNAKKKSFAVVLRRFLESYQKLQKGYENVKWTSIVLNHKSLKLELVIQAKNEQDAKSLYETIIEFSDIYCEFYTQLVMFTRQIENENNDENEEADKVDLEQNIKPDSRFFPLISELFKGLNRPYLPKRNGDRLELKQYDGDVSNAMCAYYFTVVYVVMVILNR